MNWTPLLVIISTICSFIGGYELCALRNELYEIEQLTDEEELTE
jgi:hypothetical protein